jgi:alpha-mannosidase
MVSAPGKALASRDYLSMDILRRAMAAVQHHDGVSGTEKQFVADAYAAHIIEGEDASRSLQARSLAQLVVKPKSGAAVPKFTNDSTSVFGNLDKQQEGVVVIYNSLGWTRTDWISVPINHTNYMMIDSFGLTVPSQTNPNPSATAKDAPFLLWFRATVPPLGFTTYYIHSRCFANNGCKANVGRTVFNPMDAIVLENEYLRANFSSSTYRLSQLTNKKSKVVTNVDQNILTYESYPGPGQASGAYIFRPNGPAKPISGSNPTVTQTRGLLVQEVIQQFTPWATQITRLFDKQNYLEVETRLGPIPGNNEIVSRFTTDMQTKNQIYTDDNGWEYQQRTYDSNQALPIPANFYPSIYHSYISGQNNAELSLISDRSRGVSSQSNGQIETMIHRRLLQDDGRGVGEALDDTDIVHPVLRVSFDSPNVSAQVRHQQAYQLNYPPTVYYATTPNHMNWIQTYVTDYSAMVDLPPAIHLLSLKFVGAGTKVILRLAHLHAVGESLGQPVSFDLTQTFTGFKIQTIQPVSLTANQPGM